MAGHSRPKDGVASLAYVPAIHALLCSQGVDARDKRGHDVDSPYATSSKISAIRSGMSTITSCPHGTP